MPTSIDELRLQQPKEDLLVRWPLLDARWPSPETDIGLLIAPQVAELDQIFDPEGYRAAGEVRRSALAGLMRGLEAAIQAEVPFRDHLLISATYHLIIFRPLYETGTFSGGVEAEIKHWSDLKSAGEPRRAAFIHDVNDVELALREATAGRRREVATTRIMQTALFIIREELKKQTGVTNTPDQCHNLLCGELPADLLEDLPLGWEELARLQRYALDQASRSFLYGRLTTSNVGEEGVGVFYLPADGGLHRELAEHVAAFLRGERPTPEPSIPGEIAALGLAAWAAELLDIELLS